MPFNSLQGIYFPGFCNLFSRILEMDPLSHSCLPVHVACLYELNETNKIFILGHQLVDKLPQSAIAWYTVGAFYLSTGKHHEARRFFSKASTLDPQMIPAWIGFAHSFAFESEHDQAISAYSAAARIAKGYHIFPFLNFLEVINRTCL